jgi:hypothetical protein
LPLTLDLYVPRITARSELAGHRGFLYPIPRIASRIDFVLHLGEIMPRKPAKRKQADDSDWYLDDEVWRDLLRPLFLEDDSKAECAARLFHRLLKEIEKGSEGITNVTICLEHARQVAFPFTKFAHDCEMLFRESLDKPETLTFTGLLGRKRARH